jgi:hypothetical protein
LDYWIVKLDATGGVIWSRTFGGVKEDTAWRVIETADGSFIVVGEAYSSDGDMVDQHGSGDYGVIKVDANGTLLWSKMLGGTSMDWASDVALTPDGGCLVIGCATSSNGDITNPKGSMDIWLVHLDVNGDMVYQKSLGGSDEDRCYGFSASLDGNYLVAGTTFSVDGDVSINDGLRDFWIVKVDVAGNILWETTAGGSLGEYCHSVVPTSDGGCFAAGATWSNDGDVTGQHGPAGYADGWVVKFSPNAVPTRTPSTVPLAITPNPAHSTITIQLPDNERLETLTCFDALGRSVLVQQTPNEQSVEVIALPPGMYWLQANTTMGKRYLGEFVKQ